MIDPVSEELERRAQVGLPWKLPMVGALGIHLAAIALLLATPRMGHRSLVLPKVEVRLTAAPALPAHAPPAPARTESPARPAPPRAAAKAPPKKAAPPPPRHAIPKKGAKSAPPAAPEPAPRTSAPAPVEPAGGASEGLRSAGGGIAVGPSGNGEESFPFAYYLNRLLALVESNWFRPPDAQPSQCRVLCRIDRSGRLIEAGIEQASQTPAFDRAALRAVYASAPFPPLPQGFGGATLTLHLEFGP